MARRSPRSRPTSAGHPGADEWAAIDLKREGLLKAALGQFASENSDLVQALLDSLAKLRQLTTDGYAPNHAPKPDDPFGYLNDRISVQRVQIAAGIVGGERPAVSTRYRPKRGTN